MSDTITQLQAIFREVFDDGELEIDRGTTANDIDDWDSVRHVGLVVNIEAAFRIKFTSLEVAGLESVGEMINLIEQKRA